MGAIQGAVNSILGTAARASAGVAYVKENAAKAEAREKQADEQAALDQEKGLLAKSQYHEAKADLAGLKGKSEEAGAELERAGAEAASLKDKMPGGKGNTKAALEEKRSKAMTELEAAQMAFDELQDRIDAKKAIMSRTEKIMKRTGTWGGVK